jgi:uncharacterized UPF0160 family protein
MTDSHYSKKLRLDMLSNVGIKMAAALDAIKSTSVISSANLIQSSKILLGTHDGSFHCDEAMALSFLKILPKYRDAQIVRTRDPNLLAQCNIVVDVGAVYNAENHRYDHHQREFSGTLDGYNTRLSSAGLVYKHFGKDILREVLSDDGDSTSSPNDEFVDVCFQKLYKGFVEHIDAIDNGISVSADGAPKYHISTTLSARVGSLNPAWNEEQTSEIMNARFLDAMSLTCSEFISHAQSLSRSWWPARSIVQGALDGRRQVHSSGKIMVLSQACPWKDHLFELEEKEGTDGEKVLYALYADTGGSWRIQAVPVDPNSFDSRKKLPAEWCGLRDDVLSEKAGVPGAIFIHASGFIGGHKTKEGALEMAIKALDL